MNNCIENILEVNDIELHYRDWGGSGQEIILLHGLASTSRIWDFVAPILSDKFRVIALDLRGHGLSSKPSIGYDFKSILEDVNNFIIKVNFKNPIIVGHSWGGMVALSYGAKYTYCIKGLCLIDGGTTEISSSGIKYTDMKKKFTPPDFSQTHVDEFIKRIHLKIDSSNNKLLDDIILSNFNIEDNLIKGAKLSLDNHMKIIKSIWSYKPTDIYKYIKVPVLLMPARQDNGNSAIIDKSFKNIGINDAINSLDFVKLIWLDNSIHDVPLQRPELLANNIISQFDSGFFNT